MADLVYLALGVLFFALMGVCTPSPCATGCEENAMIEPIIGLIVGVKPRRLPPAPAPVYPEKF